jgi:hypothetical protein
MLMKHKTHACGCGRDLLMHSTRHTTTTLLQPLSWRKNTTVLTDLFVLSAITAVMNLKYDHRGCELDVVQYYSSTDLLVLSRSQRSPKDRRIESLVSAFGFYLLQRERIRFFRPDSPPSKLDKKYSSPFPIIPYQRITGKSLERHQSCSYR